MKSTGNYERNHSDSFTGKERDTETGYSYFGARYYDSDLSGLFLSVDPMSDKYPSISPYAYTFTRNGISSSGARNGGTQGSVNPGKSAWPL